MTTLLLGTGNQGKLEELRALLADLPVRLIEPLDLNLELDVEEGGASYAENARRKAIAYASASLHWALADDSGLEVDALGGAPGLHSARLVGPQGNDADRRHRLLQLLQDRPQPWSARFRCSVALADPQGHVDLAHGVCQGRILGEARGRRGFGYDPLFLVEDTGKTMAELSMERKNQLSHRARAIEALRPVLSARLGLEGTSA